MAKNKKKAIKESKLKEGYLGQTLQDFLDVCVDEYIIDKIYVYGTDDIVYEGSMDDLPDDMRDAEFLEFDAYSKGRDIVTVNVDSTEEYGLDTYYTTLEDFVDDCNNENIVVFDLGAGEEIFRGGRYDIPDEVKNLIFVSFDSPDELSVNLSDYEGDSYDDDEDDEEFDESLKESNDLPTIETMFKQVGVTKVFDEDGYFTDEAMTKYEDVADKFFKGNIDKLDALCDEEKCFKEGLKESTIPVKDLLIKTDNKYDITLDHAIDDIKKKKRNPYDSLLGDEGAISTLMKRFGLEKRDVIRALNYKFDGKVLDESIEDDMEKLAGVVTAYKDNGKYVLELAWKPTTRKTHADYVDISQALNKKYGKDNVDIKVKTQEWRDGHKETHYVLEVTFKDNAIKEDANQLAKKMGAKFLPPKDYGMKKKKPRYVYEIYYYDTEDCSGDAIYRKFSSRKAQEEWYEKHKDDPDKFDMYAYPDASIYEGLDEAYNTEDRIKELKEIRKTRALTDDELEELAYCENEVSSREAEKNHLNGESLDKKLTEAPDNLGFLTDEEIEEQERQEFEKRLAQRKAERDTAKKTEQDRLAQEQAKEKAKQDAIAKGKELYNTVKDLPFDEWFQYLVPSSGKAATVAGELVRAINRVAYRDWNDGDLFYQGYGRHTCGAPVVYLMYNVEETYPELTKLVGLEGESYTKGLEKVEEIIHKHLLDNPELFGQVNEDDCLDTTKFDIDIEFEEPREYEYTVYANDYSDDYDIYLSDFINAGHVTSWEFQEHVKEIAEAQLGSSNFSMARPWSHYDDEIHLENLTEEEYNALGDVFQDRTLFSDWLRDLVDEYGDPNNPQEDDMEESVQKDWDTVEFTYDHLPITRVNPNTFERVPMEINYTYKVNQEDVEDALFELLDKNGELDDYSLESGINYVMNNFDDLVNKYEEELKNIFIHSAITDAENGDLVEDLNTFDDQMDYLAKDEDEAIKGYKKVIKKVDNSNVKSQLKKIETEEKAHKDFLTKVKKNKDIKYTEPLEEDTVKQGNKWVNKGNTGETHGEFKTKKEADAQRRAMFAGKKPNAKWGK